MDMIEDEVCLHPSSSLHHSPFAHGVAWSPMMLALVTTSATLMLRSEPLLSRSTVHMSALTFEQAVETAPKLCEALQQGESPPTLTSFLGTSEGARGFFVHWLTRDDWARADEETPPAALQVALEGAPQEVADVMVMNVIMATATAIYHRRAGRRDQADMSQRTATRAKLLVRALRERVPSLGTAVLGVRAALSTDEEKKKLMGVDAETEDAWLVFLQRWMWDDEQLERIAECMEQC